MQIFINELGVTSESSACRQAEETTAPVRLGRIFYLNSDPVYHHLEQQPSPKHLRLVFGPPAELNRLIHQGALDISPVSSIEYARHFKRYLILPGLSISSYGPVGSVFLMSRVPRTKLGGGTIWVTHESETSRALLRILLASEVDTEPEYVPVRLTVERLATDRPDGILAIGDLALRTARDASLFPYRYDLGAWWKERTGLGFVFAVWVVRESFARAHPHKVRVAHRALLESKRKSLAHPGLLCESAARRSGLPPEMLAAYFHGLVFDLNPSLLQGLRAFYDRLYGAGILDSSPPFRLFPGRTEVSIESEPLPLAR